MFKTTQRVSIKDGSILPEEEEVILAKTTRLMREIAEEKSAWENTSWLGDKPAYEWFVIGFSSELRVGDEEIPAVIISHLHLANLQKKQINVSSNKCMPIMVYNSVKASQSDVAATVRKARKTYGSKAVIMVFKKRVI